MGLLKPFKVSNLDTLFCIMLYYSLLYGCLLEIIIDCKKLDLFFFQVLLLDEITVDLDVLARANLLKYLSKECEQRGATIIYATHIFDGLEDWPTHIVSLSLFSTVKFLIEVSKFNGLNTYLTGLCCTWEVAVSIASGKSERNE